MKKIKLPIIFIGFFCIMVTGSVVADSYPKDMHGTWAEKKVENCKKEMADGSGGESMQTIDKRVRDLNIFGQCRALKVQGKSGNYKIREECFESDEVWKTTTHIKVEGNILTIKSGKNKTEKYKKCTGI